MNFFFKSWERLKVLDRPALPYAIFVVAFAIRVAGVFLSHQYLDLERYELERTAISLAHTGVYGNPYAVPTGPTAHVSPGYTLILAGLFWLFGTGVKAEIIKQVFASGVTAFQCALIIPVARELALDFRAGLLAAGFCAVFPTKFATETMGDWEAPYTAIALMLLSVLMVRVYRRQNFAVRSAVLAGLSWGVGALFASVLIPVYVGVLGIGFVSSWRSRRVAFAKFCAVACCVTTLCLSPWIVRNYFALGSPIATRTNLGIELRVSNNDQAGPDEHDNYIRGVYNRYHPLQSPTEARKVRAMGEVAYNKMVMHQAVGWIQTHPGRFIELTFDRAFLYWFYLSGPHSLVERVKYSGLALIHLAGLLGVVLLFRSDRILLRNSRKTIAVSRSPRKEQGIPSAGSQRASASFVVASVWAVILLIEPLPHYLVHVGPRHSYDIDWLLTLSAANLIVFAVTSWLMRQRVERLEPIEHVRVSAAGNRGF